MKPETSHWRDRDRYDFFDGLTVEGLAWECLRRHEPYQTYYRSLVIAGAEFAPLSAEAQNQWGLRFRGPAASVRLGSKRDLVAFQRSRGFDACGCS
ncbi:DUF6499 domain-containing protein [Mesorhizobium sp.]|uniref:transcriptional regulator domain-containing protein n=1 Tax=Mesorhizobium sp. TaxID=1871066 RepID=UPI0025EF4A91|nr:DUF6499 domain-containing protein [Mesorhizobium sp.]